MPTAQRKTPAQKLAAQKDADKKRAEKRQARAQKRAERVFKSMEEVVKYSQRTATFAMTITEKLVVGGKDIPFGIADEVLHSAQLLCEAMNRLYLRHNEQLAGDGSTAAKGKS